MGVTRAVMVAAAVIFIVRATPDVGLVYSSWAIDGLGFDQRFLGLLAQVSSVLGLVGLLVFRQSSLMNLALSAASRSRDT
jgi:hypothetical protein